MCLTRRMVSLRTVRLDSQVSGGEVQICCKISELATSLLETSADVDDPCDLQVIWGKSSKFSPQPQKVGLTHRCAQDDVVSIVTKV